MGRRKCTPKQLAALRRGREIAHRRSKKTTKGKFGDKVLGVMTFGLHPLFKMMK